MKNYQEQRKLESDNYEKQMEKMERNFKDTLKDLKDFYIQSTLNQGNVKATNLYIPQSGYTEKIIEKNNDNNNNNDEIIKLLKDNINEMNKRMEEQNEKNANALREMKDLYESQLNDLREENRRLRDNKKNITVNVNNREEEKKNDFRSKPNIIEEKKPIKKIDKKTNFYGGELIDDNDDDDIILKKNIINQMSDISKIINVVTNKKTDIINKDIEKNEFPKKPILNTNKRNLEPLEDEKKEISPNENKLRAKQQLIVNTLTINEFYNKYKSRDQNTFKNPNEENYYQIIDNKENQNNIINTINQSLVKSQISVEENFNYNNIDQILENKNKEELEGLIINTYNNLEQMSNNDILKHYVDSIKQCVNINHFDEERKKIAVSQINILPKQLGFTNNFNELNNIKMAQSVLLNKEESKIEESKLNDNINTNKNNNENENEIEDI